MLNAVGEVLEGAERNGGAFAWGGSAVGLGEVGNHHHCGAFGTQGASFKHGLLVLHTQLIQVDSLMGQEEKEPCL